MATANSGLIPLYINGYIPMNSGLPLYMSGIGTPNKTIPLYTRGYTYRIKKANIPLVLNNDDGKTQLCPLYIFGIRSDHIGDTELTSYGYRPNTKYIPLFINRPDFPAIIPLYLKVVESEPNSYISLYTFGAYISNSSIPLVIPSAISSGNQNMKLFISGY